MPRRVVEALHARGRAGGQLQPQWRALEQEFDAWGPPAREFHLGLNGRPVKTGVQNDQFVEITDGLQEGEQIVISGTTTRVPNGGGPGVPGVGGQRVQIGR